MIIDTEAMAIMQEQVESSAESESEEELLDSDEELQKAFAKGQLQSGTYKEITKKETFINDVSGLEAKLKSISKTDIAWLERLDTTISTAEEIENEEENNVHDDFKRELKFYRQAEQSVKEAIPKLHRLKIPTKRPEDYFAQMVKSDGHMKLVREKLLSKSLATERSEKARKMRELKKMGKKVQVEVLKSRQKDKREMLEQVKKYRKGQQDKLDFLEGDKTTSKSTDARKGKQNPKDIRSNKRREWKNKKFGFGGQKKRSKGNTKDSYNDSRDYSASKNSKAPKKGVSKGPKAKNARPGKSKRQSMKARKK
ncbi:EBNA1BP2 [Bugula neritina]|uniref:EBNA1BP2 n=1 Tax=Bugula neritina TaxID=10212 RepID=A0A7J7KNY6_BUGNE|nr:EBNA1BP2 [Bugula neritina]